MVLITHDRRFLQNVANEIAELDRGRLTSWKGDYRGFLRYQEQQLAAEVVTIDVLFDVESRPRQAGQACRDDDLVIEPGRHQELCLGLGHNEYAPFAFHQGYLVDAERTQPLGPRPLDVFQIVRVIDDPGQIGVFIVNTYGKFKMRFIQTCQSGVWPVCKIPLELYREKKKFPAP